MFPYIIFISLILFFYWKRQPAYMLLVMLVFAAIRSDVGWDYGNYYDICTNENMLKYVKEKYSIVWSTFFSIAYSLEVPHLGIVIPNIITYIVVYKAVALFCDNDRKILSFALLVYALWPDFYLTSLSTIRQHLAVSLALYSGVLFIKDRKVPALALSAFNFLIHPSSIIIVAIFLILFMKRKVTIVHVLLLSGITVLSLVLVDDVLNIINIAEIQEYKDTYLSWDQNYGGKYKYLLGLVLLMLVTMFINIKNGMVLLSKISTITIVGVVFSLFVYASGASSVLGRIATYFTTYLLIALYPMLRQLRNSVVWRYVAIIFLVCTFFIQLFMVQDAVQFHSTSSYVPYRTIFSAL